MPKMKTHRGARKRFRRTGGGRWVHKQTNRSHLLAKKAAKRKRQLRRKGIVDGSDVARLSRLLPYA
ncbi:MAG TPA: 50S ribosomal protein L35 [Bacillota bacterium]